MKIIVSSDSLSYNEYTINRARKTIIDSSSTSARLEDGNEMYMTRNILTNI